MLNRFKQTQIQIRPGHWVLFFTLLGFGLRVQRLSFQPLWGDEGWSFYFASRPVADLLALTAADIHPPLYYLLLKGWLGLAGTGPEEARLFSVSIGVLLIPALAALGKRLYSARLGAVAAGVVALTPLAIYYAQEVRMYGLVTVLGVLSVYFFLKNVDDPSPGATVGYALTTTAALYTHYYALFLAALQALFLLLVPTLRRRSPSLPLFRRLAPLFYVGLLYLPWVIYVSLQLVSYIENKRNVEGYVPLDPISFVGSHLVAFSLGHLVDILQPHAWLALPVVLIAVVGMAAALRRLSRPRAALLYGYLFGPLLLGYLVNLIYPFTPRYFERTLLLAAPAYWLLTALGLLWLGGRQRWLAGGAATLATLVVLVNLNSFYTVPRYPEEDYRPLLKEVAARATPADTLLASYQWQLGFYHAYLPAPRPRLFPVPGWGAGWSSQTDQPSSLTADLTRILAQSPRLWFPAYQAGGHIWEDEAEAAIARLGYPALLHWYNPQTKLTLAGAGRPETTPAPAANFDNKLALPAASLGQGPYQAGREIAPVTLRWQKLGSLGSQHRVNLRLVDAAGRTWTTRDSFPLAGQAFFTDLVQGETLDDRHGLLTPVGAPPGVYKLLLSVRRVSDAHPLDLVDAAGQPVGAELTLGEITLIPPDPPVGAAALPVQVLTQANFGPQVRLVGYSLGHGPFKAGQTLPLTLFWEALADAPGPLTVLVELQDSTGQPVIAQQNPPIWPASEWRRGTLLRDPQDFTLPPTLQPGPYRLSVALLGKDQAPLPVNNALRLILETITTTDRPRLFDPPASQIELGAEFQQKARLVGLDLPRSRVGPGETLPLTLYWQALDTFDKNWTVFVHLVDEQGQIVAQQDQIPGGGQFPTTSWVPDEFLIDPYSLQIPPDTPPGQNSYRLNIGLYDANDFSRLPLVENGEIVGDHVTLESWPISVE